MTERLKKTPFDAAKYVRTPVDVIDLLNDALESGHAPYIARALGVISRSSGMTKLAEATGVNRQALYTAPSEGGNPTLETLLRVVGALGIKLRCEAEQKKAA